MKGILFVVFFLAGCASVTGGNKPEQAESVPKVSGTYSITSLYDGDVESKERAAKWMDAKVRNMCASDYTLLSEESVPTMNPLGEVTFSRLIWQIRCVQQTERAKAP